MTPSVGLLLGSLLCEQELGEQSSSRRNVDGKCTLGDLHLNGKSVRATQRGKFSCKCHH